MEILKETGKLKDLDLNGSIILIWFFKVTGYEGPEWIQPAQKKSRLVNAIMETIYTNKTPEQSVLLKYGELFRLVSGS